LSNPLKFFDLEKSFKTVPSFGEMRKKCGEKFSGKN
jgi:hypothetical protein